MTARRRYYAALLVIGIYCESLLLIEESACFARPRSRAEAAGLHGPMRAPRRYRRE